MSSKKCFQGVYIFYRSWVCSLNMGGKFREVQKSLLMGTERAGKFRSHCLRQGKNREVWTPFLVTLQAYVCLLRLQISLGPGSCYALQEASSVNYVIFARPPDFTQCTVGRGHMSHITCQLSCFMTHMSCFTWDVSPVTCHMSLVTV